MEQFWNIVHYFVYKAYNNAALLFQKYNPILWITQHIYQLPFAKRHFAKMSIDDPMKLVKTTVNKINSNYEWGISSIYAGGFMNIVVGFSSFGLYFSYFIIKQEELNMTIFHLIGIGIIPFVVNYYLLFKKDKYIRYFHRFDKMTRSWKIKWAWISVGAIVVLLIWGIGTLYIVLRMNLLNF